MPSIHQAPLVREMAKQADGPVVVVTESSGVGSRSKMGWSAPDFGNAIVFSGPTPAQTRHIVDNYARGAFNVVSGIRASSFIEGVANELVSGDEFVLFQTERWDNRGVAGLIRPFLYRERVKRLALKPKVGLLAMGGAGVVAFEKLGFPREKILRFAYYVDSTTDHTSSDSRVGAVYVGNLIPRKRVDLLLESFRDHKFAECLTVIGDGPMKEPLQRAHSNNPAVRFLPPVSNICIQESISRHELLILPSQFDGWGAVVNEALVTGTPVVCSNQVGASTLLDGEGPLRGGIFERGSSESLALQAKKIVGQFRGNRTLHRDIRNWALEEISPAKGAQLLLSRLRQADNSGRILWDPV